MWKPLPWVNATTLLRGTSGERGANYSGASVLGAGFGVPLSPGIRYFAVTLLGIVPGITPMPHHC